MERSRPNESLLIGPGVEIEAGGHLPGWLDPGSGITAAPFGSLLHFRYKLTELGRKKQVTIKRSSQVGIGLRDLVIRVRGAIWKAADQTRAYGTALASRLSREVRSPGRLDPGGGATEVGPRW